MYSYSFVGNPEWSDRFAKGDEIQAYLEKVSADYNVTKSIRFNETVEECHYKNGCWYLTTSKNETLTADFVIAATGILHHPAFPDIEGKDNFQGEMFHSAQWDHSVDYQSKKIGIIGTGSTATQIISTLSKAADRLTVFQRTAQWICPLMDRPYTEIDKARLRGKPWKTTALHRWYSFMLRNLISNAVIGKPVQRALLTWVVKLYLRLKVKCPELRDKLTPDYQIGCKRLIFSDEFFDAIQSDNVILETGGIECITSRGVRTREGVEHALDVLIFATGFHPFDFMRPMKLTGRDGLSIDEAWSKKVQAYRSVCLPGFPNFFLMLGPNSPIGNYSVIAISEAQADYILKLIDHWRRGELKVVEATEEAKQRFNRYLKMGMHKTAWVGNCQSWYMDAEGDLALWPYTWNQWLRELQTPDLQDFLPETINKT